METLSFNNIFEVIAKTPQEAADMKFRSNLMLVLRGMFEKQKMTQAQIGAKLNLSQPRVSELVRGKVDKFSSDKLIEFLSIMGFELFPTYNGSTRGKELPVKCTVRANSARLEEAACA